MEIQKDRRKTATILHILIRLLHIRDLYVLFFAKIDCLDRSTLSEGQWRENSPAAELITMLFSTTSRNGSNRYEGPSLRRRLSNTRSQDTNDNFFKWWVSNHLSAQGSSRRVGWIREKVRTSRCRSALVSSWRKRYARVLMCLNSADKS